MNPSNHFKRGSNPFLSSNNFYFTLLIIQHLNRAISKIKPIQVNAHTHTPVKAFKANKNKNIKNNNTHTHTSNQQIYHTQGKKNNR